MKFILKTLISRLIRDYRLVFTLTFIALLLLTFRGLLNLNNLDFADLGSFPIYPKLYLDIYYYNWVNQNVGFQGSSLPYALIIFIYSVIFKNPGLAEKIWLFSLLIVGEFSMYKLSGLICNHNKLISTFLPILYVFNPVTAGLIFEGSINDTLTVYVFFPLLIYLLIRIFDFKNVYGYRFVLLFSLIYTYVFFWNPQISMWILPIFIFLFIFYIISKNNTVKQKMFVVSSFLIFFVISTFLTGTLNIIIKLASGNGYKVIGSGILSYTDTLIDLQDNFNGQFAFSYWYFFVIIIISLILLYVLIPRKEKSKFNALHYSIILESIIILVTWSFFHFKLNNFTIIIASKLPELAAYEPFLGVTILFALIIFDSTIIFSNLDIKHFKKLNAQHSKALKIFLIVLILIIFLTPSFNYWRQDNIFSVSDYITNPQYINNEYKIPNNIEDIAVWFHDNTNISQEYRTLMLPAAPMSKEALYSYMTWTTSPQLPNNLWQQLLSNNTESFSAGISFYGIEYIILYHGPYIKADPVSSYTGKARVTPAGFPWQLTYNPQGSYKNWTKLFENDKYFTNIANIDNATIYKNNLYNGVISAYKWNNNDSINNIKYSTQFNKLLYKGNSNIVNNKWHGFNFGGVKNNWTMLKNNTLYGSSIPSSLTYVNLNEKINLKNNSYYDLNYSMNGQYLNNSYIAIRFYNNSGNVVETYIPQTFSGNLTQIGFNDMFKTPKNFSYACIFPTYSKATNHNNQTFVYMHLDLYNLTEMKPLKVKYNFTNPTSGKIDLPYQGNLLILYSMAYNPGWAMNGTILSNSFNNKYFNENYFVVNGNENYSINFEPQTSHSESIIITWTTFVSIIFIYIAMYIVERKKNGQA